MDARKETECSFEFCLDETILAWSLAEQTCSLLDSGIRLEPVHGNALLKQAVGPVWGGGVIFYSFIYF